MYCLQINEIAIDVSEGVRQEFLQDCQVCCRPNSLLVTVNRELGTIDVEVGAV